MVREAIREEGFHQQRIRHSVQRQAADEIEKIRDRLISLGGRLALGPAIGELGDICSALTELRDWLRP